MPTASVNSMYRTPWTKVTCSTSRFSRMAETNSAAMSCDEIVPVTGQLDLGELRFAPPRAEQPLRVAVGHERRLAAVEPYPLFGHAGHLAEPHVVGRANRHFTDDLDVIGHRDDARLPRRVGSPRHVNLAVCHHRGDRADDSVERLAEHPDLKGVDPAHLAIEPPEERRVAVDEFAAGHHVDRQ